MVEKMKTDKEQKLISSLELLAHIMVIGGVILAAETLSWVWLILSIIGLWKLNFYRGLK